MDNQLNKAFTDIVKCYLHNEVYLPSENLNIKDLMTLADSQKLIAMVYLVLKKSNVSLTDEQSDIFKQYYYASVKNAAMQAKVIKKLTALAQEKGIAYCFFKGSDLRKLYAPNEEIRTMGDIDVLIGEKDKQIIFGELRQQGVNDIEYYKGTDSFTLDGINIEMHGVVNYFDKEIITAEDIEGNSLPLEKYLFLLVTHIAHHISSSGCGLRQLIDIAKFYSEYDELIDYGKYNAYMAGMGLDRFGKIITMLVDKLFNVKSGHSYADLDDNLLSGAFTLLMRDFMLSNGVFGLDDTAALAEMRSAKLSISGKGKPSRFKTLRNLLFPPLNHLANGYPNVKKHKWLYPYYALIRIYKAIFIKKINGKAFINGTGNIEKINEKKALLEALDIK